MTVQVTADIPDVGVALGDTALKGVQRQLAVDFLVYRATISQELRKTNPDKKVTQDVLKELHGNLEGYWKDVFNPTIRAGYIGSTTNLDKEVAEAAVGKYSGVLADQINSVSDKAFLEGYHAALNKGWEKAVAWQRISEAYGLDPAQMRQWVSYYPTEGYHPEEIPKKSKDQRDKMLKSRAERIGDNEGTNLQNLGKQIEWQQQHIKGDIPDLAKKVWRTAKDELVCPVCAPMDAIAIPVNAQFKTANGKYFVPPVHVNCRCSVYILRAEDDVVKSMGRDRYNRDAKGRFARTEGRTSRNISRRMSAFQVEHEVVLPPKKKSQKEKEKEYLYSLPHVIASLPHEAKQVMNTPVSVQAQEKENKKIKAKRSEKIRAKKTGKDNAQQNLKLTANQKTKLIRNDSTITLEGSAYSAETDDPNVLHYKNIGQYTVGELIDKGILEKEPVDNINMANTGGDYTAFAVVLPKGAVIMDKDGKVSSESTARLLRTDHATSTFSRDSHDDVEMSASVDAMQRESIGEDLPIGIDIHTFVPEEDMDSYEEHGNLLITD